MNYRYFEAFLDSVLVIDQQACLIYCNEAAGQLCGINFSEDKVGQKLNKWFTFENGFLSDPSILSSNTEGVPYVEGVMRVGEGWAVTVGASVIKLDHGPNQETHWMVVIRELDQANQMTTSLRQKEGQISKLEEAQNQLEQYSKNLEFMVRQRTMALNKTNLTIKSILNSLGQGILVFDEQGSLLPIASKACEVLFEQKPPYLWIQEVLRIDHRELETFKLWLSHLYSETIPFDSVKELGPQKLNLVNNRYVTLDYFPIRNDENKITSVVLVATDKTEEVRAREEADKERNYVKMVLRISRNRRQFKTFLKDAHDLISMIGSAVKELRSKLYNTDDQFVLDYSSQISTCLRSLHTLKGGSATFSITTLASVCHEFEDWLVQIKGFGDVLMQEEFQQIETYYRQISDTLETFLKQNEALIGSLGSNAGRQLEFSLEEMWRMANSMSKINTTEERLFYIAKEALCEPIINSLAHFDEVVLSTASVLGKQVSPIVFKNTQIKIFPENFSGVLLTLVHAFRNSVDHGIESPDERQRLGKPASGLIIVNCEEYKKNGSDWIKLEITDDGAGMDPNLIREKMAERGIPGHDSLTDQEVLQSVFLSQFSTRDRVTEISGRGVGLDAIMYEVDKMGGKVEAHSILGKGMTIEINVPNRIDASILNRSLAKVA